jgi:hypothetical protein
LVPNTITDPMTLTFDAGSRYDFLLLTACINDIDAIRLVADVLETLDELKERTRIACDLRRALSDIRTVLPNATVAVMGYHLVVSRQSNLPPNCDPTRAIVALGGLGGALAALAAQETRDKSADRAAVFRLEAKEALFESATALDDGGNGGRGSVRFVNIIEAFRPEHAFGAPSARVFGVTCRGGALFAPTDPVAGDRAQACAAFFNPTGANPNSVGEEICRRGSAFHPNVAGQIAMADAFIRALRGPIQQAARLRDRPTRTP